MKEITQVNAKRYQDGKIAIVSDLLTTEEMLSISINGNPYTITMRTPGFEEEHVRGILLTEDVYSNQKVNPKFEIIEKNANSVITKVNIIIPQSELEFGIEQKRNLLSVSSCGMCGKFEMDLTLHGRLQHHHYLHSSLIEKMFLEMSTHQEAFSKSGGCHSSALFTIDGQFLDCKEDIGRHNAVDKVIGSLLMKGRLSEAQVILVSGRVSYEIVSKTHKAGIPFLCSVSAPSSMAVEYCQQCGITLLAFCRGNKFTIYSNDEFIIFDK